MRRSSLRKAGSLQSSRSENPNLAGNRRPKVEAVPKFLTPPLHPAHLERRDRHLQGHHQGHLQGHYQGHLGLQRGLHQQVQLPPDFQASFQNQELSITTSIGRNSIDIRAMVMSDSESSGQIAPWSTAVRWHLLFSFSLLSLLRCPS